MSRVVEFLTDNRVYKSLVRHGAPTDVRNRALAVYSNLFLHIHPTKVRSRAIAFSRTWYLGGLSAACFALLTITGVLLMVFYRPAVPQAYDDMKDLQFVVSLGLFMRNLHRFAAHAMVALVFLHMVITFYRGAYRAPREFNWALGVFLFVVTIFLSYTGYLLPWDQLAFWAVTVGTKMAAAAPLVGERLHFLLLGGTQIGENALLRFYVLHCVALPLVAFVGIGVHVWRLRKDGGIYLGPAEQTPLVEKPSGRGTSHAEEMVSTWPHLLARELVAFLAITLVLVLVSIAFDAPLEAIANPNLTPNPAKAPWYFLGLQELLHYYSPFVSGVLLPGLVILALAAIPYFDLNLVRSRLWAGRNRKRRLVRLWGVLGVTSVVLAVGGAHPVWPLIIPLLLVGAVMSAGAIPRRRVGLSRWLAARSLPFWIFTWFVIVSVVLTVIGVYFRGPNWDFTLPWRDGIF